MSIQSPLRPPKRRYTSDTLVYESFYIALRNALVVAFAPIMVFLFLAAVEDYPLNMPFLHTLWTMTEMAFIIGFFVNFLYYVYFIKISRIWSCIAILVISCGLAFIMFSDDLKNVMSDEFQAIVVVGWFLLLAVIMVVEKFGMGPKNENRYETESWLYRHELAASGDEEEDEDPEDKYTHRYIDPVPEDYDDEDEEDKPLK
jgi:hypothetical protein